MVATIRERVSKQQISSWQVMFRIGRLQASESFDNAKSAAKFAALVEAVGGDGARRMLRQQKNQPDPTRTLDDLFIEYVGWKESRGDITERGAKDYRRDWENWITPWLGHREADTVTEGDVQRWVDHMSKRLNPKTVRDRHALLHGVYAWANSKTRGYAHQDPCTETELPKRKKTSVKGLRIPEYKALLTAARALDPDAADFIAFLGCTGWRFSEAAALPVWAVDDDGANVYVDVAQVVRRGTRGAAIEADEAKSQAGLRRIRLIGESVEVVRRRIVGRKPTDLVFTAARGGRWHPGPFRDRKWLPAVEAAGLADRGPTPHWLRHTHVFICRAAGMPLAEIQRRIGHEDIRTTINVYGRMFDDMPEDVAARMDAILGADSPVVVGEVVTEDRPAIP